MLQLITGKDWIFDEESNGKLLLSTAFLIHLKHLIQSHQFTQPDTLPHKRIFRNEPSIYVTQREYAVLDINKQPHIRYIGSQDATTCCIVLFKNVRLNRVSCVHLDGSNYPTALLNTIQRTLQVPTTSEDSASTDILETYIIGSYVDENEHSIKNVELLLDMMYRSKMTFLIKSCYILDMNTRNKTVISTHGAVKVNCPIYSSLIYESQTGSIYHGEFEDKGPELPLRSISGFMGNDPLLCVYDYENDRFVIGPNEHQAYSYKTFQPLKVIDQILTLPDSILLEHFSTSPYAEGDDFAEQMRDNLRFMRQHPDYRELYGPNNRAIVYQRGGRNDLEEETWVLITEPE